MAYSSLTEQAKTIESRVGVILANFDPDTLTQAERLLWGNIKHEAIDARLAVRDYEYADTRVHQLAYAREGRQFLVNLEKQILKASEHNIFSAVDVAQLTAQIDSLKAALA